MDKNQDRLLPAEPAAKDYESLDRNELHQRLKIFILHLLENDFGKLRQLIYRHDVSETLFNRALAEPHREQKADRIAGLVIERELQKIATRRAYRKQKEQNKLNQKEE